MLLQKVLKNVKFLRYICYLTSYRFSVYVIQNSKKKKLTDLCVIINFVTIPTRISYLSSRFKKKKKCLQ